MSDRTKDPSAIMLDVYASGIGSPSIECVCGREHCAPNSPYADLGEGDRMRERAAKSDRVILYESDDSVSAAFVGGNTVVRDCRCGWLANFERLIWAERGRILGYYKKRREAALALSAELDAEIAAHE